VVRRSHGSSGTARTVARLPCIDMREVERLADDLAVARDQILFAVSKTLNDEAFIALVSFLGGLTGRVTERLKPGLAARCPRINSTSVRARPLGPQSVAMCQAGSNEVTKQLPHNGREFECRNEEHKRVAQESELTRA
jgi:hypothetical protein